MNAIWYDGKLKDASKISVNILSHALHYGTSVFEGIRAYETSQGPVVFRLKEHVDRLFRSASVFDMKVSFTKTSIANAIRAVVRENHLKECYIRPLIFFGEGTMALSLEGARIHVAIAAWPWPAY